MKVNHKFGCFDSFEFSRIFTNFH